MQSADSKQKAAERAATVAFLGGGIALVAFVLASGVGNSIGSLVLALFLLLSVLFGLPTRGIALLQKYVGGGFLGFLGVFIPAAGGLIFALYPIALGIGAGAGISVPTSDLISGVLVSVAALANVVILILNLLLMFKQGSTC